LDCQPEQVYQGIVSKFMLGKLSNKYLFSFFCVL